MREKVNKTKLLHCLETVDPAIDPANSVQQSACVVFKGGWVYAFTGELMVKTRSPLPKDFSAAVVGRPLIEVVRRLPDEDVTVEANGVAFAVRGKGRWAKVRMETEVHLPVGDVETPADWHPLPDDFCEALAVVQECCMKESLSFKLSCVHLHPGYAEATDRLRIARWNWEKKLSLSGPTLVRQSAAKAVAALTPVEIAETPQWLHFRTSDKTRISVAKNEEVYPDLSNYYGGDLGRKVKLPKEVIEACDFAGVFSRENVGDDQVVVELGDGRLKVRGTGVSGEAGKSQNVAYAGPPVSFRVGPEILAKVVDKYSVVRVSGGALRATGPRWTVLVSTATADGGSNGRQTGSAEEAAAET